MRAIQDTYVSSLGRRASYRKNIVARLARAAAAATRLPSNTYGWLGHERPARFKEQKSKPQEIIQQTLADTASASDGLSQ